ncbi:DUF3592 domain-containing protein [Kitasatospora sp. NPDC097605]|uniref:DUF3592 domain-containing protein n=1 Tax=Kitasatospora sp. NPDC097605 TaxID=3157226 RepID=UPI003321558F
MTSTRRVSGARKFAAFMFGCFAAFGGWCAATGYLHSFTAGDCGPGTPCQDDVTALLTTAGVVLWLLALFGALGLAENRDVEKPQRLPLAMTTAGVVFLGLLGAVPAGGAPRPWLLAAAGLFALLTLVAGVRGERRIRRENAERLALRNLAARLHTSGLSVPGTVIDVQHADHRPTPGAAAQRLRLTVRFTAPDGRAYTLTHTGTFPSYALPGAGSGLTVRHDPQDPSAALVAESGPSAAPPLSEELERLAALHRDGALDAAEFAAAKARLLGTGLSAGANGGR